MFRHLPECRLLVWDRAQTAWGKVGQVTGCQNNLEVGDPLTGYNYPDVTLNGRCVSSAGIGLLLVVLQTTHGWSRGKVLRQQHL
jgi:hypothetical protein